MADERSVERSGAGRRVDSAVGERCADERQVATVDLDGALSKVRVDRLLDLVPDDVAGAKQVGYRPVAMPGLSLGAVDRLVHVEPPAGVGRVGIEDAIEARTAAREISDERHGCDGAGVDHRVDGEPRLRVEANRVERIAGRLDADGLPDPGNSGVGEGQAVVSGLEMDWSVNRCRVSPASYTAPDGVARQMPNVSGSAPASSGMYDATRRARLQRGSRADARDSAAEAIADDGRRTG